MMGCSYQTAWLSGGDFIRKTGAAKHNDISPQMVFRQFWLKLTCAGFQPFRG
jgi:hypothetical protein